MGIEILVALTRERKALETEYVLSQSADVCRGESASSSELSRSVMTMPDGYAGSVLYLSVTMDDM